MNVILTGLPLALTWLTTTSANTPTVITLTANHSGDKLSEISSLKLTLSLEDANLEMPMLSPLVLDSSTEPSLMERDFGKLLTSEPTLALLSKTIVKHF